MKFYQAFNNSLGQNGSKMEQEIFEYFLENLDFKEFAKKNNIVLNNEQEKIIEICKKMERNIEYGLLCKKLTDDEVNLILSLDFGKRAIGFLKRIELFNQISFKEYLKYEKTEEENIQNQIHFSIKKELLKFNKKIIKEFKLNLYRYLFNENINYIKLELTNYGEILD